MKKWSNMKFERLGNIVLIKKGRKPDITDIPIIGSVRVLQIDDLRNDKNLKYTNDKSGVFATEDDVLIAWDGANAGTIGYGKTGYIGSTIALLRKIEPEKYSTSFIGKFLQSKFETLRSKTTGATIPHIDRKTLDGLKIPEISIYDQIHIAKILSQAENLIAQRKESIQLLDEFLKSTFLEMFGDPATNPRKWKVKTLGENIEYIGDIGSNGSNENVAKNLVMLETEDYAIMIRTVNLNANDFIKNVKYISKKTYDYFSKSKIFGGELIMNKIGSAGQFWIMPNLGRPVSLGLNQLVIRLRELNTLYLYYYLSTNYGRVNIKSRINGATTKSITKSAVKALPLLYPPIELQTQFAQIVESTEVIKAQYQSSLQELENLYGSLSQRAYKGELLAKDGEMMMAAEAKENYSKQI